MTLADGVDGDPVEHLGLRFWRLLGLRWAGECIELFREFQELISECMRGSPVGSGTFSFEKISTAGAVTSGVERMVQALAAGEYADVLTVPPDTPLGIKSAWESTRQMTLILADPEGR